MSENENVTDGSTDTLDSLVIQYQAKADAVKIEDFPNPNDFKFKPQKGKKYDQIFDYPTNETILSIYKAIHFYSEVAFTSNAGIKSFVCQTYQLEKEVQWFICIDEIKFELNKIIQKGKFKVDAPSILETIDEYIKLKIRAFLISKYFTKIGKDEFIYHIVKSHLKANKKAKKEGRLRVNSNDKELLEIGLGIIIESLNMINGKQNDPYRAISICFDGRCESLFFPKIFNDYIVPIDAQSETYAQRLLVVFDLFRLVMKDRMLWSEIDYENQNVTFNSYEAYKKKAVRNILQLK